MGARGNSGVITSQIFRGMAEGLAGKRHLNGLDLAHALTVGSRTAYKAVVKPVEGTILTVIREASEAAVGCGGALKRRGSGPDGDGRGRRGGPREDAVAPADPAGGRRGRCGRCRAGPCVRRRSQLSRRGRAGTAGESHGPTSLHARRPRRRWLRLRDDVPAPAPARRVAGRRRDPHRAGRDRRFGARGGGRAGREGPRPQRAARRGARATAPSRGV